MKNIFYIVGVAWMVCSLIGCSETKKESTDAVQYDEPFQVEFKTSKGDVVIEVHPEWAPIGAAHFKMLVEAKYYDDARFFRVLKDFMAQTGINGDPKINAQYSTMTIQDEPVKQGNKRGYVTFGQAAAPNTRSTHIFFNFADNAHLDRNFPAFAKVVSGMDVVDSFYSGYGPESANQPAIEKQGNEYLEKNFPKLDYIITARLLGSDSDVKEKEEKTK